MCKHFRNCYEVNKIASQLTASPKYNKEVAQIKHGTKKSLKRLTCQSLAKENQSSNQHLYHESQRENSSSPPKNAKFTENLSEIGNVFVSNQSKSKGSAPVGSINEVSNDPQCSDIFGDTFSPEELTNISCVNDQSSCLQNSKSYPTTPNFEVCSEELQLQSDIFDKKDYSNGGTHNNIIDNSNHIKHNIQKGININADQDKQEISPCKTNPLQDYNASRSNAISKGMANSNLIQELKLSTYQLSNNDKTFKSPQNTFTPCLIRQKTAAVPSDACNFFSRDTEKNILTVRNSWEGKPKESPSHMQEHVKLEPRISPASFVFSDSDTDAHIEPSPEFSLTLRSKKQFTG